MGKIFGPVEEILQCHELFYAALTARTMTWTVEQRVGDIFPSSVSVFRGERKEVVVVGGGGMWFSIHTSECEW